MPNIWPDLQAILSFDTATGTGLISLFTAGLWLLAAWIGVYALVQWRRCRRTASYYDELLEGVSEAQMLERRKRLRDDAAEAGSLGRFWIDFDDSLVLAPDGSQLFQSVAADSIFHDGTVNAPLMRNHQLTIAPVFLLLLGIAGSLTTLLLVGNAAAAFVPTIWGVIVAALTFVMIKSLQALVRQPVADLQMRIDGLFSQLTSEQVLSKIADHSGRSAASLQEMITILEQQMEMILARTRQAVRFEHNKSLEQILSPGVEGLVGDLNTKSEAILAELKDQYLAEVEEAHKTQSVMLSDSIQAMKDDTEQMGLEIANFFVQVDQQFRTVDAAAEKRQEDMEARLNEAMTELKSEMETRLTASSADSQSVLALLKGEVADQMRSLEAKESERESRLFGEIRALEAKDGEREKRLFDEIRALETKDQERQARLSDEIKRVCELQASLAARVDALMERQDQDFQALQAIVRTIVAGFKGDVPPQNPGDLQSVPRSPAASYETRK